ncbi:patatin-like phospholipase family protein [Sphingomonas arantia]|uniref:Patatin-like phospholipase family protein n=1 Tax=Sphingomonas arantia TaxID=1460676 RepID=A0ABW4TVX0_9SPHN
MTRVKRLGRACAGRIAALCLGLCIAGCATVAPRTPYTLADASAASPMAGHPVRMWARGDTVRYDQVRDELVAQRRRVGLPPPSTILALSGGSDKGAFSAGLLNAWTRRGDRPQFDVVTGVSTGALIAPFAFLGSSEDATLTQIYTHVSQADIFRKRGILGALGQAGVVDTTPLQTLIARYITPAFLDRIAAEHRRGRRLFVVTTNLDAQRGVVWDMGAIATDPSPDRARLFARVLLASSSIPGAFSPVLIDATAGGRHFSEMHVDGGAVGGFFAVPRTILSENASVVLAPDTRIYVLYNGRLNPTFKVVRKRILSVAGGALATLLGEIDRNAIDELRDFARGAKAHLSICSIEDDLPSDEKPVFDTVRMRQLYRFGEQAATIPHSCLTP